MQTRKVPPRLDHGGALGQGKRKSKRPFSPKQPLHVVLRSARARGEWSMLNPAHVARIDAELDRLAKMARVQIHRQVNLGDHLHLLITSPSRSGLRIFLRGVAGTLVTLITGAKKGEQALDAARFWDFIPYSRVVEPGAEYETLERHFVRGTFEPKGWNRKRDPHLKQMWRSLESAGLTPINTPEKS